MLHSNLQYIWYRLSFALGFGSHMAADLIGFHSKVSDYACTNATLYENIHVYYVFLCMCFWLSVTYANEWVFPCICILAIYARSNEIVFIF